MSRIQVIASLIEEVRSARASGWPGIERGLSHATEMAYVALAMIPEYQPAALKIVEVFCDAVNLHADTVIIAADHRIADRLACEDES